jgi:hypothetical protein
MLRWIALMSAMVFVLAITGLILSSQPPIAPPQQQAVTNNQKEQTEKKQDKNLFDRWFPDTISIYTLFLVLFTGLLVVVGAYQWKALVRAEHIAVDQVFRSHRAWVGLFGQPEIAEPLTFDAAGGAHIAIRLNIKNVGESPAFHVVLMSARLFVGSRQRDPRTFIADVNRELVQTITETAGILALPGDPIPWAVVRPQAEILDRDNLPVRVWFSGFFAYRDEFNRIHTSSFLFSYVASDGSQEIQSVGISAGRFEPFGFGWNTD